jgi:hypothetical protein
MRIGCLQDRISSNVAPGITRRLQAEIVASGDGRIVKVLREGVVNMYLPTVSG